MTTLRFSSRARSDLAEIAAYTKSTWGSAQTSRYIAEIEDSCELIAQNRLMGRPADHLYKGLRRTEHGRHVIFYTTNKAETIIRRILHQRMLPNLYQF